MPVLIKCEICGKLFNVRPSDKDRRKCCSKECANKYKMTGSYIKCDNCGKKFYRNKYHIERQKDKNNFCCEKCEFEYKHKIHTEIRKCEICGKEFECNISSTQRFCSNKCNSEWQKTLIDENNKNCKKVKYKCDYCGNEIRKN